ncbi:MAG: enoyl-CoA hydratase/isomerase family protein [Rhizobiaceae bacterium]
MQDFGGGDEIRFERMGKAGVVTLTRPKALNAVTHGMVLALSKALDAWGADDAVELVVLKAEGRAFCAGGDIMRVYEAGKAGRPIAVFFHDEYLLNAQIARFAKPYVSLIDGIVMGGGAGISVHGSHRVMTENAIFAMPEVGIGFFPDIGGSYFLPRLKGEFGLYLGLTGERIRNGDALWSGLATHAVAAADLGTVFDELCATGRPDAVLKAHASSPSRETHDAAVHAINDAFAPSDLAGIIAGLESAPEDEFRQRTLATLLKRSPTSLNVVCRQVRAGAMLSMNECMVMEFRIVNRMLEGHDFYEGIRAAIVEKGSTPIWRPSTLAEVDPTEIERYFSPLPQGDLAL